MKLIQALIASCISAFIMIVLKKKANLFLMRFFRNLSRHKSRKRLYGNEAALIPILLGREKPVKNPIDELDPNTLEKWTLAEIAERDGRTESTPIFIAVKGRVYDVSSARKMYGPSGTYHALAGREASYAFATSCYRPECLIGDLTKLTEEQKIELNTWDELYALHDKYKFMGLLTTTVDPVEEAVSKAISEEQNISHDNDNSVDSNIRSEGTIEVHVE